MQQACLLCRDTLGMRATKNAKVGKAARAMWVVGWGCGQWESSHVCGSTVQSENQPTGSTINVVRRNSRTNANAVNGTEDHQRGKNGENRSMF